MEKRGQGIQFNWVFVVIAGAIILAFFVLFTLKYVELQDAKQDVAAARMFTNTLAYLEGSSVEGGLAIDSSSDQAFRINYFTDINISCDSNESYISIGKSEFSKQHLQDEIVFAPSQMKVNSLDAWIYPWNHPFFISNFVFLSRPDKKIYLKYDAATKDFVENLEITKRAEFDVEMITDLSKVNGRDITVVWFSSLAPDMKVVNSTGSKASYFKFLRVIAQKSDSKYISGKLIFYENGKEREEKFYGEALLYGAIFGEGATGYKCGFNRSLSRLKKVTDVVSARIDLLLRENKIADCTGMYLDMKSMLRDYSAGKGFDIIQTIADENTKLIGKGCVSGF